MHIGRALAKLNPRNVRFDVGTGGIPELTPQDIAAALGMVEEGLGREMLCQVWWPDGAKLTEAHLLEILANAQRLEWQIREDKMLSATLAVAQNGDRARGVFNAAKANRWPNMVVFEHELPVARSEYERIRLAVLAEASGAGLCQSCAGRAFVQPKDGPIVLCPTCLGTGHARATDRSRASACEIEWTPYRDRWMKVYVWTYDLCTQSVQRAAEQFHRALE